MERRQGFEVGEAGWREQFYYKTKWAKLSCRMGDHTPGQCCARCNNSLKPDGKKGQWSDEEDEHSIRLHAEFGNQRSKISSGG